MDYKVKLDRLRSYYIGVVEGVRKSGGEITPEINKILDACTHDMIICTNKE